MPESEYTGGLIEQIDGKTGLRHVQRLQRKQATCRARHTCSAIQPTSPTPGGFGLPGLRQCGNPAANRRVLCVYVS
jgi:hypothetical protein